MLKYEGKLCIRMALQCFWQYACHVIILLNRLCTSRGLYLQYACHLIILLNQLCTSRGLYLQVTFIEALDGLMPGFDPEIGKLAQRVLINPRKIDWHTGVLAKKVSNFVMVCPQNQSYWIVCFLHSTCLSVHMSGLTILCRLPLPKMEDQLQLSLLTQRPKSQRKYWR